MTDFLSRTRLLLGDHVVETLRKKRVFIAGLGGVGSYAAETIARSGIDNVTLLDADTVTESNINRQLIALRSTLGQKKTEIMRARILDINPGCQVECIDKFMRVGNVSDILSGYYDAVIDAIDILNCKLDFLTTAYQQGYTLYSSLGSGNRTDPTKIVSGDLFESRHCRLAKVLRKKLRQAGITQGIQAVWSTEIGRAPDVDLVDQKNRPFLGSISTIPALFGVTLAGLVVQDFINHAGRSI